MTPLGRALALLGLMAGLMAVAVAYDRVGIDPVRFARGAWQVVAAVVD